MAVLVLMPIIWILDINKKDGLTFLTRWFDKKLLKGGLLCGIPLFLACNLQQLGLVEEDSGKTAFLTAMYIVIVPLIGIFRKRMPSPIIPVSVALAVFGLYALTGANGAITTTDLLLIGCAVMFTLQITFVDIFAPDVDALRLNTLQVLICATLSAIVMFFTETPTLSGIGQAWLPLAHTGFLSMGAAYSLQIIGQKSLEPSTASIIMSLESVFALIFGWLILGDQLTTWESVGCISIFVAVILSRIPIKTKTSV
jgi:drug/metabolite transporter (DMT)-like permease